MVPTFGEKAIKARRQRREGEDTTGKLQLGWPEESDSAIIRSPFTDIDLDWPSENQHSKSCQMRFFQNPGLLGIIFELFERKGGRGVCSSCPI
jgi:hypothetical protein